MPKVHVHGNQVTLPDDLRSVLTSAADDVIEAEEVEEGVLLQTLADQPPSRRPCRCAQSAVRHPLRRSRTAAER